MDVVEFSRKQQKILRHAGAFQRKTLQAANIKQNSVFARRVSPSSLTGYRRSEHLNTNAAIRDRVRKLVDDLRLNSRALAKQVGVNPTQFSRWLNAKDNRSLDLDQLDRLVACLDSYGTRIFETVDAIKRVMLDSANAKRRRRSS